MWKILTRGLCEPLQRRICRTNIYSQNNEETISTEQKQKLQARQRQLHAQLQKSRPRKCFLKKFDKTPFKNPYLITIAKQQCKNFEEKRKNEQRNYEQKINWSEAFGWSGVLALGYIFCQSIFVRRNIFEVGHLNVEKWKKKLIVNPQIQAHQAVCSILLPKPQYILPTPKEIEDLTEDWTENSNKDTSEDLVDGAVNIEQTYGPITAEEALKQAFDGFSFTNDVVLAELEFNSGVLAIEQSRYKDAVYHFTSGAKMSSVRSMFNLGLCYELGLGTAKNFKKAVKYFTKAAKEGHVDAMYNVGVYFAQGKGGVHLNLDAAKHWFVEAAEKGQLNAIKALQLEEAFNKQQFPLEPKINDVLKVKTKKNTKTSVLSIIVTYKNTIRTSIDTQTESDEFSSSLDYDLSSPSPTDMFLGILGMHKQNVVPYGNCS